MLIFQVCETQRHISIKLLPKRQTRALRQTLEALYSGIRPGLPASPVHHSGEGKYNGEPTTSLDRDFQRRKKEVRGVLKCKTKTLKKNLVTYL